jgi:NADH dehydrogenase (ubiquinone) Fe-S protein 5
MSSAVGAFGGVSRCFEFWKEYENCIKIMKLEDKEPEECALLGEDYLECLHHKKEVGLFLKKDLFLRSNSSFLFFFLT